MQIILTAVDDALANAWNRFCGDLPFVEVHRGSTFDISCDAIVSPANSFGFMDGGIDALYLNPFGDALQLRVREMITTRHFGELIVGTADLVELYDRSIPYMIVAPTMRVPMILRDSVNAYLAARAVLLLVTTGSFRSGAHTGTPVSEKIQRVAFPGLGTGVGQMGPNACARQIRQAIDDILLNLILPPQSWAEASERHQSLYTDRPRRLQQNDISL